MSRTCLVVLCPVVYFFFFFVYYVFLIARSSKIAVLLNSLTPFLNMSENLIQVVHTWQC